jgi:hypothetical protein
MMVMVMVTPGERAAHDAGQGCRKAEWDQVLVMRHVQQACPQQLPHGLEPRPAAARQQHRQIALEGENG